MIWAVRDFTSSYTQNTAITHKINNMCVQEHYEIWWLDKCTHHSDILKHLYNGWVDEVVSGSIVEESFDHWLKKEVPHYVSVIKLVLQPNDFPHETQSTWTREMSAKGTERFNSQAITDVCQQGSTACLVFIQNKLVLVNNAAGPECGIIWHVLK